MADAVEVLETMQEVAKLRITMLRDGITFHEAEKRLMYLQQYEARLREIEQLIRRYRIRLVPDKR